MCAHLGGTPVRVTTPTRRDQRRDALAHRALPHYHQAPSAGEGGGGGDGPSGEGEGEVSEAAAGAKPDAPFGLVAITGAGAADSPAIVSFGAPSTATARAYAAAASTAVSKCPREMSSPPRQSLA